MERFGSNDVDVPVLIHAFIKSIAFTCISFKSISFTWLVE